MWAGPSLLSQSHSSLIRRPIQSDMFYSVKRSKALQPANRKMLQKHNRSSIQRKEKEKKCFKDKQNIDLTKQTVFLETIT